MAEPLVGLALDPSAWSVWTEADRLLTLTRNTLYLVALTLLLCLPAGVVAALLCYRTDLPGRRLFRAVVLLTLFVPLPLFTSGWQAALGSDGWLRVDRWNAPRPSSIDQRGVVWSPWGQGLVSAAWIHAVAGLPWVVLLTGQGLRRVEPELEEDALTAAGSLLVVWRVTLPRASAAIGAAALWVALQTATEITVTDVMQVRTFAEEVYTRLVVNEALGPPLAAALPVALLSACFAAWVARTWERQLPAAAASPRPPLLFRLGPLRWPLAVVGGYLAALLLAVPVGSLVWRAGRQGKPPTWSAEVVGQHLNLVARAEWHLLAGSLAVALAAGVTAACLGLLACWTALDARGLRPALLGVMAFAWAVPGPVVGLGLRTVIERLLDLTDGWYPLAWALYYGPSVVPLWWAHLVRFFPAAVAVLWPATRLLPPELREAAFLEGATPGQELRTVIWPLLCPTWLLAALAVGVLSMGELAACKVVSTPGQPSYAEAVFTQMHYGVTNDLAARCLLLLLLVALGALGVIGWSQGGAGGEEGRAPGAGPTS